MPILKNPRHERFAQELALGKSQDEAYELAGYATNASNAARLNRNEPIRARAAEILAAGAIRAEISEELVLREMGRLAFADMRRAVKWGRKTIGTGKKAKEINEVVLFDSDDLDEATAAAIAEISETSTGGIRIKFHDKRGALNDLGRHFGMFKDKIELGGHVQVANIELLEKLTSAERDRIRQTLLAAAARGAPGEDEPTGVVPAVK